MVIGILYQEGLKKGIGYGKKQFTVTRSIPNHFLKIVEIIIFGTLNLRSKYRTATRRLLLMASCALYFAEFLS